MITTSAWIIIYLNFFIVFILTFFVEKNLLNNLPSNYLFTLNTLIQQAINSGNGVLITLALAAQNDLNQIINQIDTTIPVSSGFPVRNARDLLPTDFFQNSRWTIAQHIAIITVALQ